VGTITEGKMAGCRAVGAGSNVKKRGKAVRLAMAVTLQIFEGALVVQELQHVVVQARLALAVVGGNQLVAAPGEPAAIPEATRPAGVAVAVGLASARPDGKVDPSAPRECLEDPFTELRVWTEAQNGEPAVLWPYCTICNCWSGASHQNGKHHRRALANSSASQTTPSHECASVDKRDPGAQPSRIEETVPPMDTEVIVEGNLSSLASFPGSLTSDWMWDSGFMQQSVPWLPQVGPAVQEGLSWYPFAGLPPPSGQTSQAPEQLQQSDGNEPQRIWTHAINNMPWEAPQQVATSSSARRSEATAAPPWTSAGAPVSVEQEQENTDESRAAVEEVVILPKCRWTDRIASVATETDVKSPEHASTLGGCIEV